ncbi:Purine ribonucleoside efflux pump NepI [Streptomyces sp. YIM 121038]|uniref:MFS transporter n=1 Tax=Streptomyces sp. YIM 121038 TaxID=2136401 RepID=UPI001110B54C|nr:MFS transporter [Streptomyces sp. YIM 121038]QCX76638.1 Purine ribonucleoside efflux pump NepI [Streptomyces sp. YIM 121038]
METPTETLTQTPHVDTRQRALPLSVVAVAAATFSVVTTEMLPVGLLTSLSSGLGVSDGTAGLTVTLPGVVAALAALLLPVAVRGADRRAVLCGLMLLLGAANLLSALAPSFEVLLVARIVVGLCIGGVWAVAASLAVRLVRAESVGRATAVIFSGIAVASVLGVPAGTFLGELASWRWAFGAMAVLGLGVAALLAVVLPALPPSEPVRLGVFPGLLRLPRLRVGLIAVAFLVVGHFTAYTYVRPVLERVPDVGAGLISGLLLCYGVAGVAGNFLGGTFAARDPRRTLLLISAALAGVVLLLVPAGSSLPASVALLVAWGLAYGGVSVSSQNWVMAAAPQAREAASALFAGIFNTAIALGALLGGRVADGLGATDVLWLGGGLAVLALGVVATAGRSAR